MNPNNVKKDSGSENPLRQLPAMHVLLDHPLTATLVRYFSMPQVRQALDRALDLFRTGAGQQKTSPSPEDVIRKAAWLIDEVELERLRPVINATGIILHTGLGRAVLPTAAVRSLGKMDRCSNLQIDLKTGQRGKRNFTTESLLCLITGAEAAMIVNNNAAATFLILSALCSGRDVIISRGQLIEIGGSYRLPDCIRQSGANMVEIGTTNKTHLKDYSEALSDNTAAILRCNPSNYRIVGFTKEVPTAELATLKKDYPFILIDDLGCGALVNLEQFGLPAEPTIQESLQAGADLVCASGDKLIGGPQSGIILGRKDLIQRIRKHPLTRILRVCKLTDIALQETLRLFLHPETLLEKNPTLRMISLKIEYLEAAAASFKAKIESAGLPLSIRILKEESATGGGSLPHAPLETRVLAISSSEMPADELAFRLRRIETPVITRIQKDEVLLDMRTIMEGEDEIIVYILKTIFRPDDEEQP